MPADPTKTATPEMVTMPAGQANGAGPRKPVFHPGLGVEGVILPPPITSELRQSAKRAAVSPAGARTGNIKVIACDDNRSAELYKAAVASVGEVYPGAKLEAVNWDEVPVRPRARMWIPSTFKEPEQLLKMLQRCNLRLPTHDWRVAKNEETPGPTHQAVIILNKESLAPIDAAGGELNFGFSSVFIRVYKSDAAVGGSPSGKPAEEDITAKLEAPSVRQWTAIILTRSPLQGTSEISGRRVTWRLPQIWHPRTRMLTLQWWSVNLQMSVKILQINLHHCKAASATLLLRLAGGGADVDLIQEPWMACAFLDIEGAFNNVFPDVITGALTGLGIEGRLAGLINQLLTSRAVTSSTLTREEWAVKPPGKPGSLTFYTDGSKLKNQDIPGNCIADELARKGTMKLLLPDKEDTSMPVATCKLLLHNQSKHKNTLCWQTSLLGRVALTRQSQQKRLLTRCPLNDRSCRDVEEEESPEHFFCSYPALSNRRLRTLGKPFLDDLSGLSAIPPRKIALFIQSSNWTPF
ncbi:hypothetical protein ACLKA6_017653 [Drosophila palustris]